MVVLVIVFYYWFMTGVNGSNTTIVTRLWHLGAPGIKLYTSLWLGTIGSTIWNFQHIKAYFGSLIYWDLLITVDTPVPFGTGKITGLYEEKGTRIGQDESEIMTSVVTSWSVANFAMNSFAKCFILWYQVLISRFL